MVIGGARSCTDQLVHGNTDHVLGDHHGTATRLVYMEARMDEDGRWSVVGDRGIVGTDPEMEKILPGGRSQYESKQEAKVIK